MLVLSGIAVIAILAVAALAVFVMTGTQYVEPPRREGPPAQVMQGSKPHLWLLVKQAEYRQIGSRCGGMRRELRHHFEIHCHDATTTAVIWRRRLLTLRDVVRLPGSSTEFLQGAFLIKAGTRVPLALGEPGGALILHRTRVDAEGRLALTRVDPGFASAWSATLPFTELNNRWELPGQLLLSGAVAFVEAGVSRQHELLVAVDLRDGRLQSWNVTRDEATPSR